MMGLLIKDLKLMKNQKNFFILIFVVAIGLVAVEKETSFIVSYVTFIGSIFTLSTISYDEYDNGNAYLFSLPITRKGYVMEKYGFGLLTGSCAWLLGTALCLGAGHIKGWGSPVEAMMTSLMILPVFLILLAVMLPFQIRFGSEKGRIAMIGALGILLLAVLGIVSFVKAWRPDIITAFNRLPALDMGALVAIGLVVAALLFALSCRISVSIMNKKEF